jgi:hypothetical protein
MAASTVQSVPWRRAGGTSDIECAQRAPPGNVGDNVGAYVGAEVGARVGGLVSPGLVGAGVGAAHAHNRTALVR